VYVAARNGLGTTKNAVLRTPQVPVVASTPTKPVRSSALSSVLARGITKKQATPLKKKRDIYTTPAGVAHGAVIDSFITDVLRL